MDLIHTAWDNDLHSHGLMLDQKKLMTFRPLL